MEKHTRSLKDERFFYKNLETNQPYEVVAITEDNEYVMRNLITGVVNIYHFKMVTSDFIEIIQAEVFDCIDNNDDQQHADMMTALGIGYICPFCGGRLCWESDFMASEVHGMGESYIEITNPQTIEFLKEKEGEYMGSRLMGITDDIEKEKAKFEESGYYDFTYLREDKDGVSTYYEIDDSVIGMYRCSHCGKHYEIQDCLPSEEDEYPYFNDGE